MKTEERRKKKEDKRQKTEDRRQKEKKEERKERRKKRKKKEKKEERKKKTEERKKKEEEKNKSDATVSLGFDQSEGRNSEKKTKKPLCTFYLSTEVKMLVLLLSLAWSFVSLFGSSLPVLGLPVLYSIYPQWGRSLAVYFVWFWTLKGFVTLRLPWLVCFVLLFLCLKPCQIPLFVVLVVP